MQLVFDLEGDNLLLDISVIHCLVLRDVESKEIYTFDEGDFDAALELLQKAQLIIAHNGISYDIPVLQKFFPTFKVDPNKIFDTLLVSRLLRPDRVGGHSLKVLGKDLGYPKGDCTDFSKYTPEMLEYCIQDVLITEQIFLNMKEEAREYWDAIRMENMFATYIAAQIKNGFTLDVEKVTALYDVLNEERVPLQQYLVDIMPKLRVLTETYKGAKKDGRILEEKEESFSYITAKTRLVKTSVFKYIDANPGSTDQMASYLKTKGWVPYEFTKTEKPSMKAEHIKYVNIPEVKDYLRYSRLTKQMSMIKDGKKAWLKHVRGNRVHGNVITIGANTHRCTHSTPNMAQVDKKDIRMREVWLPKEGWKLVGCDASGIELRLLGHYLAGYDQGVFAYKASKPKDIVDLHKDNQLAIGLASRNAAKTIIYALIYGAGKAKLGAIYTSDLDIKYSTVDELRKYGDTVRDSLFEELRGYEELLAGVGDAYKCRERLYAIDRRPLYPRSDYSALNLLIQSAGAIVMKQALIQFVNLMSASGYEMEKDYGIVANVHDEFQVECKPEIAEKTGEIGREAIKKAGEYYKLKVALDGEYKVGNNWGETH